jgi:HEAT repeat protein
MKHTIQIGTAALLLLAAPSVYAQTNDSAQGFDRERGELSPGTQAPTQDALMQAIESASPQRLIGMLEYGERVECHTCVPLLQRRLLEDNDARVREIAAWWLRRRPFGFAAVFREIRVELETSSDPVRRARAAEAIGEFMDPHGVAPLTVALEDTDVNVRVAAVRGLGRINAQTSHAGIVLAMEDADPTVREAAVHQALRVNFFRDHDALIGLLGDDSINVRRRTALTVGTFRVADAVPALTAMLVGDSDTYVRQAAAWALGRIGGTEARTALTDQREAESESLVRDAIDIALRMR